MAGGEGGGGGGGGLIYTSDTITAEATLQFYYTPFRKSAHKRMEAQTRTWKHKRLNTHQFAQTRDSHTRYYTNTPTTIRPE